MTTNSKDDGIFAPLIAFLWPRVSNAHAMLAEARRNDEAEAANSFELQFRTLTLLMASEPARTWADVEPKVIAQALARHDQVCDAAPADAHLLAMLEAAIMLDHAMLNGDHQPT